MISVTPAIKRLKIRNLGPIRKVDGKFTKGINIIYGLNASGKTTAVNAINHMVKGEELIYGPTKLWGEMVKTEIEVELWANRMRMQISIPMIITKSGDHPPFFSFKSSDLKSPDRSTEEETSFKIYATIMSMCEGQAIILDCVLDWLSEKSRKDLLKELKKSKAQVIITTKREDMLIKGANVIRLEHKDNTYNIIKAMKAPSKVRKDIKEIVEFCSKNLKDGEEFTVAGCKIKFKQLKLKKGKVDGGLK